MAMRYEAPKPEIKIFYCDNHDYTKAIEEISLGLEEEGIPYVVESQGGVKDPVALAFKAAESSRLGVGIGVGPQIVLHYIKLNQDHPLFEIPYTTNEEKLRSLGSNAARLIKGMPFKDLG